MGCGDGPASFNAETSAAGGRVTSVDPLYRYSTAEIQQRIAEATPLVLENTQRTADSFVWQRFRTMDELAATRVAAMDAFLSDYSSSRSDGRYVCGALPQLPFASDSFDLCLCSHLLFVYSDLWSLEQHRDAIVEMCRVAREVRIFPLVKMFDGGRSQHLAQVVDQLERAGHRSEVRIVPYEFVRGGNEMLVVTRSAR